MAPDSHTEDAAISYQSLDFGWSSARYQFVKPGHAVLLYIALPGCCHPFANLHFWMLIPIPMTFRFVYVVLERPAILIN